METLETKSPELGGTSETESSTKKDTKAVSKTEPKEAKQERRSLFEKPKAEAKNESLFDLFEKKADKNPPLETLAPDEKALVVEDQTQHNLSAANAELVGAEPSGPNEAAAIAGATFNEAVRERIDNGEDPTSEMLDGAMNDTAEILGLNPNDIDDDDPEIPVAEDSPDADPGAAEPLDATDEEPVSTERTEAEPINPTDDTPEEPADVDPPASVPPVAPVAPTPPNPNIPPPVPPVPPVGPPRGPGGPAGPVGPGGPIPPGGAHHGFGPGGFNLPPINPNLGNAFNTALAANPWLSPNVAANLVTAARPNRRHSHLPYVLAGGVVGYLIGRRRGRIKTEKKLLPVQKKLENQVNDLEYQVATREARIRKLAYEKAISHPHIFVELPKRLKELQELQTASLKKKDFMPKHAERKLAKEAAAAVVSAELLGKVTSLTERPAPVEEQTPKPRTHTAESLKPAHDMGVAELLDIAAQIPIEDRNLRHLYETGRIDQKGLRRVIEAYLRGERYDNILAENLKTERNIATLPEISAIAGPQVAATIIPQRVDVSSQDPGLSSARQTYYETLMHPDEEFGSESSRGLTVIIAVGVVIAIVAAVMLVF